MPTRERGRYKIFLGMAAGVGKTYRMLQEGQAEAEAGPRRRRSATSRPTGAPRRRRSSRGSRSLPRRRVDYRGTTLEEMDLPGDPRAGARAGLIDELAHTNAPGVEHAKRYEDIADVLDAGIDVFSTVNVQHLESLNDQVAELTGVARARDRARRGARRADEMVLVDLTPEALIARLRAGKVYPPERVDGRAERLLPHREPRRAARGRAAPGGRGGRGRSGLVARAEPLGTREDARSLEAAPQAVAERLLALVTPGRSSQRVVRRAWRSAQRLDGELDVLDVRAPGASRAREEREQLEALRRLAAMLGAPPARRGGRRRRRGRRARRARARHDLRPDRRAARAARAAPASASRCPTRLLRALPGVDLRIVADRKGEPPER